jgi:glycolate oxidase subunit GlcD
VSAEQELAAMLGSEHVVTGSTRLYLTDATEGRLPPGRADAVVLPATAEQVAQVMRWCYDHDMPLVARGGGTGLAGGAVPTEGGVVVGLEGMHALRSVQPELWRAHVGAGVTTADVHRLARENGLFYAPDPGAAALSQLGGNIATNAGGPHTFKYGVTGSWVTGLEMVLAPGEVVTIGGPIRKDVAGYDIRSLMIGSEGTLGIVTSAWLKLLPAPELELPVAALYAGAEQGCDALGAVFSNGLLPAALEYLDEGTLRAAPPPFHGAARFMLLAAADGSAPEARRLRTELVDVLGEQAIAIHAPQDRRAIGALWRWRAGVSYGVSAQRGAKVSEDIVVPIERLADAIGETQAIGARHQLEACSWGHAGDGNLHSTFVIDARRPAEVESADRAAGELFALARRLGGSVSGEHGLGLVKGGALAGQWSPEALALHESIKRAFDPKGLINPGKKLARGEP